MSCPVAYLRGEINYLKSVVLSFFADIFETKIDTAKVKIAKLFILSSLQ